MTTKSFLNERFFKFKKYGIYLSCITDPVIHSRSKKKSYLHKKTLFLTYSCLLLRYFICLYGRYSMDSLNLNFLLFYYQRFSFCAFNSILVKFEVSFSYVKSVAKISKERIQILKSTAVSPSRKIQYRQIFVYTLILLFLLIYII